MNQEFHTDSPTAIQANKEFKEALDKALEASSKFVNSVEDNIDNELDLIQVSEKMFELLDDPWLWWNAQLLGRLIQDIQGMEAKKKLFSRSKNNDEYGLKAFNTSLLIANVLKQLQKNHDARIQAKKPKRRPKTVDKVVDNSGKSVDITKTTRRRTASSKN